MKRKNLWLLVGIPGSGKSYWVKKEIAKHGGIIVSRDKIRYSLVDAHEFYFSKEKEVFKLYCNQIQSYILDEDAPNDIYADATQLTENGRLKVVIGLKGNYSLNAIYFNTPLEVALKRNQGRKGREVVPEDVVKRMYECMSYPGNDQFLTYDKIITIEGKDKK